MKRKLISFEAFDKIQKESLSNAEQELVELQEILANTLQAENLSLRCFGAEDVLYENSDGTYVHANYIFEDGHVVLDNIQQLVIDEATEENKAKEILGKLLDSLVENNKDKTQELFREYLEMPRTNRVLSEVKKWRVVPIRRAGKTVGYKKAKWNTGTPHHRESSSITSKRMRSKKKNNRKRSASMKNAMKIRRARIQRQLPEWNNLCENVFNYVSVKEFGPVIKQAEIQQDNKGNVSSVKIPGLKLRNEGKLLSANWKTLNTDLIVLRSKTKKLNEDAGFCKAVAELKKHNNLSDDVALEESLGDIVARWPNLILLTQNELSNAIKVALEAVNAMNFDDQTCDFMAEGLLRVAHNSYVDKVSKVLQLAGKTVSEESEDKYADFQNVVNDFYPTLDENSRLEMQVFVDLYNTIREVFELATNEKNDLIRTEASTYLSDLSAVIEHKLEPSLELASDAAEWLQEFVETNLEGSDWNVSNNTHVTTNGDHPVTNTYARKSYTPASDFSGDWGDASPVSDGKSYKNGLADEMQSNGFANMDGSSDNPYVPKPLGDYKIKGEKHIDDDDALGNWQSGDTWPNLSNPYVPSSVTPKVKSDNAFVDK